jgi:hypothetical protein
MKAAAQRARAAKRHQMSRDIILTPLGAFKGLLSNIRGTFNRPPKHAKSLREFKVYIYLNTNDSDKIHRIESLVDQLIDLLGFDGPFDVEIKRGSWIRKSTARVKSGLNSSDVRARLASLEQILALYGIDDKQAQVNEKFAAVLSQLIDALKDIPDACITAGSTLVVKYESNGRSVIRNRNLTENEVRALRKYPEIQSDSRNVFNALALAVERMEEDAQMNSA